jgi:hypothetical protein
MDLTSERDPAFARYTAAWRAYQAAQASDRAAPMPYTQAISASANPVVRAAATELAAARYAWLAEVDVDVDVDV